VRACEIKNEIIVSTDFMPVFLALTLRLGTILHHGFKRLRLRLMQDQIRRIGETHSLAIPLLAAPAVAVFIDETSPSAAAPNIIAHGRLPWCSAFITKRSDAVAQPFLAQALHQALAETCLPANKGQAPAAEPAAPWKSAQLPQA
jgi:hypothetical protein